MEPFIVVDVQGNLSSDSITLPSCPKKFYCSNESLKSWDIGQIPSYVAIVSSALSCLGSILIVVVFLAFKDLRTGAQKIITLLAIADFIAAFGYIIGSINFLVLVHNSNPSHCKVFDAICETQAAITSWSSLSSFLWNIILAFYFYFMIVYHYKKMSRPSLMLAYNIIAWALPLFIIIPLLELGKLGYAPYATSNWCFVKSEHYGTEKLTDEGHVIVYILVAGKFWEVLSYIVIIVVFTHIFGYLYWQWGQQERQLLAQPEIIEQAERRLVFIPIFFILLRIWGTIQFFFSIGMPSTPHQGCKGMCTAFFTLGILQAIGNPGPGWGNAILYVFMSPILRGRLLLFCRNHCCPDRQPIVTFDDTTVSAADH